MFAGAATAGYYVGALASQNQCGMKQLKDTVEQGNASIQRVAISLADMLAIVPIRTVRQVFQYNSSFAAPPPVHGEAEPIWDTIIPSKSLVLRTQVVD